MKTSHSEVMKRVERLRELAKRLRRRQDDPRARRVAENLEIAARWLAKRAPN